ncbi:UDP-glucuronosyltransferase 2B19-like isoform X1 [Spodoptera litura]|uniref:UDP-glucuronosyltransferase 2B19-like isoform X1 n=1 Tax=Spodoptera litura TaxID=69820 RepID=A0A9J7DRV7_SPOLT|nr:UDP-glucuronosyltransferase 2B19-like isoform X1 [Spodoptera litura]
MLLSIVFIMIFASACEGYKILALLPYPGKSHFMVFEPILEELARRGHHVTVVSFFPSASPQANRRDVSLVGLAPLNVEVINLQDFDNPTFLSSKLQFSLISNIMAFNLQLCQTVLYSDIFEEFVKGEGAYDVVLSEHFHTDCMMGIVHNYRAPSVALMSCALTPWAFSRFGADDNPAVFPSMVLPLVDEMSFLEKLVNAFNVNFYKYWHSYATRNEQKLVETRLGRKLPPLNELAKNASVVLVNTHHTLNGVRVLPPSVVEVGGIHLHNKTVKPLPENLERWVSESRHGFILFSFGSLIRGSSLPPKRSEAILKVFARLPQRVLWKWETEDIKGLPDNVLVLKWLPQYDLLNHPNCVAFITHGGLLSLTEIVAAGVPALVIPILGDQPGNAAFAKRAGIAEVLEFHQIDEETFYNALMKVLTPEKRDHAKAFSSRWWERPLPPMETAIHYIENTAKYGYLNMSPPGRLMHKPELLFFMSIEYLVLFSLIFFIALLAKYFFCPQKIEKFKQS